jgi:hypothetical protein
MPGHARSLLARLVALLALLALVSAPMAARAQQPPEQPGARPPMAPPGATAPPLRVPDESSWRVYHASSKNQGAAVAIEFFLPGLGSAYGGHWQGAAITWGMSAAGFLTFLWGAMRTGIADEEDPSPLPPAAMLAGIGIYVGGRIHGLVDAYQSSGRYNRRLAQRLGLGGGMVLTPMPLQTSGETALGLGASWRF